MGGYYVSCALENYRWRHLLLLRGSPSRERARGRQHTAAGALTDPCTPSDGTQRMNTGSDEPPRDLERFTYPF